VNGARRAVGVLVSGVGTNLEALIRACDGAGFPAHIVLVVSNRRGAPALDIAQRRGVAAMAMPQSDFGGSSVRRDHAMLQRMRDAGAELVVCAGYDRILSDEFLHAYPDAILNVHPSLLPAFGGGMDAVEQALAHGVKVTGCTVQLLEPGVTDGGPIVLQQAVDVLPDDTVETLRRRVHALEWKLLPHAVELWCTNRLRLDGRAVRILDRDAGSVEGPVAAGAPPPSPLPGATGAASRLGRQPPTGATQLHGADITS
jgi:phosphoribosylglycinamide formyltransferase 1